MANERDREPGTTPDPLLATKRQVDVDAHRQDSALLDDAQWRKMSRAIGPPVIAGWTNPWLAVPILVAILAVALMHLNNAWTYAIFAIAFIAMIALARWSKARAFARIAKDANAAADKSSIR
jgi:hypothetical protein